MLQVHKSRTLSRDENKIPLYQWVSFEQFPYPSPNADDGSTSRLR